MKDKDIVLAEKEARLTGQIHSLRQVELEVLRLQKRIDAYEKTKKSIKTEIEKTKMSIEEIKKDIPEKEKTEGGD